MKQLQKLDKIFSLILQSSINLPSFLNLCVLSLHLSLGTEYLFFLRDTVNPCGSTRNPDVALKGKVEHRLYSSYIFDL